MGNSESHSLNDHEDGCKEAEKLEECVADHFGTKMKDIGIKLSTEAYKATYHDEDDDKVVCYLKRGACKESVTAFVEGPDRDKFGTMRECMEAHPNYYHKYLSMCERTDKKVKAEIESTYPFIYVKDRDTAFIDHHKALTEEGDFCKEQYAAYKGCCLRSRSSSSWGVDFF